MQRQFERVHHDPAQRHRDHRFRAPTDLRPDDPKPLNVLVVGSCLSTGLTHFLELGGHDWEYVPFNFLHGYPERSNAELGAFDCLLVQLMLRSVWSEHHYMRLAHADPQAWTDLFERACDQMEQFLDAALVYHAQSGC